ncbi:MAG: hypothetical protein M1820_005200 [Bogoriella megaspora]|nr:MAG: hypothetical protein M1820_005200 [Bogoriella megaspora]
MAPSQVVLITGANTGIGYEALKAFAAASEAYHILVGSRSAEKGNEAIAALQKEFPQTASKFTLVQVDIDTDESINKAFETVSGITNHIDALVNNAGWAPDPYINSSKTGTRDGWIAGYNTNVVGTHIMTQVFMPLLLKSSTPRLLFVTSGMSTLGGHVGKHKRPRQYLPAGWPKQDPRNNVAYRSSKAALNMMMLEWERAMKNDGVKVWCLSPGMLATNLGGIGPDKLREIGAEDPSVGGIFIKDVVEGKRDEDTGKVIMRDGIQPW